MCYNCCMCGQCDRPAKLVDQSQKRKCYVCQIDIPDDVDTCPKCGKHIPFLPSLMPGQKKA